MQVMLSIQAGKVLPSMLLLKLNSNNHQNRLYRAFRELGRVIQTLFLLRYFSESDLRHSIRAETAKIESFNYFLDWIKFGGQVIKSGDPIEQTKQVKYSDLGANAIMLHNVSDLNDVPDQLATEGQLISEECVVSLSQYIRDHIRQCGQYSVGMNRRPPRTSPKVRTYQPVS